MLKLPAGALVFLLLVAVGAAQAAEFAGTVRDETGGALPGVSVELRSGVGSSQTTATDGQGRYRFDAPPGRYRVVFTLINFASDRRDVDVLYAGTRTDVVLHLSLSA